jgi:hypothetical protein
MKRLALAPNDIPFMVFTSEVKEFDHWGGIPWTSNPAAVWWFHQKGRDMAMAKLSPADFWYEYLEIQHPPSVYYCPGATFSVRAEAVQARPRVFYERLLTLFTEMDHINPEYGHYMERYWGSIFLDGDDSSHHDLCNGSNMSNTIMLKNLASSLPQHQVTYDEFVRGLLQAVESEAASEKDRLTSLAAENLATQIVASS